MALRRALDVARTALLMIDWQTDFCGPGGYVDAMGYDLALTRAPLAPARRVLARWRDLRGGGVHTREGHKPDLSDPGRQALALAADRGDGVTIARFEEDRKRYRQSDQDSRCQRTRIPAITPTTRPSSTAPLEQTITGARTRRRVQATTAR